MYTLFVQADQLMINDRIAYKDTIYRVYDITRHKDYVTIGLSKSTFTRLQYREIKAQNNYVFAVHH